MSKRTEMEIVCVNFIDGRNGDVTENWFKVIRRAPPTTNQSFVCFTYIFFLFFLLLQSHFELDLCTRAYNAVFN